MTTNTTDFTIVSPADAKNPYAGSDVPGEFRQLTDLLGAEQIALSVIRVPAHSDFEQRTGHYHERIEELYVVTQGTLTMRLGDEVRSVQAPAAVRVAPHTPRSHRNEGDEPVEIWAISRNEGNGDAVKIDDFWEASPDAVQNRN
jgi:mannose-6-phosphate isomerase-like protein (cupin superfamily)